MQWFYKIFVSEKKVTDNLPLTRYHMGDIIGVAVDLKAGKLWWLKNGIWIDEKILNKYMNHIRKLLFFRKIKKIVYRK